MAEQDVIALRAETVRLGKMVNALMNRAERAMSAQGSDFGLFQTTVTLERQVRERTQDLEAAVQENEKINRDLQRAMTQLEQEKEEQRKLIKQLEETHNQLLQSEKLASIGQLAAGVAHEINNPIGFVNSNLGALKRYTDDLLRVINAYESALCLLPPSPERDVVEVARKEVDLAYLREDVVALIAESIDGAARVRNIVQDLRDFSRIGDTNWEQADLRTGLDSTLNLLANEIKYKAELVREYGELPSVECIPSQLNQVFMNLLVNAAQAIPQRGTITVRCAQDGEYVWVSVSDSGAGIPADHLPRIFDPFYTTKPVGSGTGLGLSVSYGIVERHGGRIDVDSQVGVGTTFTVWLPIQRSPGSSGGE